MSLFIMLSIVHAKIVIVMIMRFMEIQFFMIIFCFVLLKSCNSNKYNPLGNKFISMDISDQQEIS